MVLAAVLLTHEKETPESLVAAIKTGSERKRWQKASELSNELNRRGQGIRDKALLGEIASMLADSKAFDPKTRSYMAMALARFDDPDAVRALVAALEDPSDDVRFYAIWSLGSMGAKDAAPAILPSLESPKKELRVNAAYVLGALGAREAAPELKNLVADPDDDVRWNAALALARLGDASGEGVLREMLDRGRYKPKKMDEDAIERAMANAAKGLALIGDAESIKILRSVADSDPNLRVRQAAMDALNYRNAGDSGKITGTKANS
jgi:HEAT repeat protein